MLTNFFSDYQLVCLTLVAFLLLVLFRYLYIKKTLLILLYHIVLFSLFLMAIIGQGGVQNEEEHYLEKFIELEKNNKLDEAKKNPENSDLPEYLLKFENSDAFKTHLQKYDHQLLQTIAISIGWFLVLICDIILIFRYILLDIDVRLF